MQTPSHRTLRPTALIVEDQLPMRAALRDLLATRFPAAKVLEASDGTSALAQFADWQPALVLMDVCLPDANGIELTERIKALRMETVVVVVSIDNVPRIRDKALAAGAHAFVPKDRIFADLEPLLSRLNAELKVAA